MSKPILNYSIFKKIEPILDFIFPPYCAGCDLVGFYLCPDCSNKIRPITGPVCQKCGEPLSSTFHDVNECKKLLKSIEWIRSYSLYQPPLSNAIQKLKYQRNISVVEKLALFFTELYNQFKMDIDIIVPVPLNKNRIRERGFNQANLLGIPFSTQVKKPLVFKALSKKLDTRTQVGLQRSDRFENVSNAFLGDEELVSGKNILLIDDVATTGATLEACASALKTANAKDIFGFTLARATHTHAGFTDQLFHNNSNQIF